MAELEKHAVTPDKLPEAAEKMMEQPNSRFITTTCLDEGLWFRLHYLFSLGGRVVSLETRVPKEDPRVPSISGVVRAASWIEREISDLFGVAFEWHEHPGELIAKAGGFSEKPLREPLRSETPAEQCVPIELLLSSGCVQPRTTTLDRRREQAGLPKLDVACTNQKALSEVQEICRRLGLDEKVGFDWRTNKLARREK